VVAHRVCLDVAEEVPPEQQWSVSTWLSGH